MCNRHLTAGIMSNTALFRALCVKGGTHPQYWGLEDFMTVNERPVYNSANLAMFMVNVSHAMMRPMRTRWPECSVNDLKAWFRSRKYVVEILKLLPEMPEPIFIDQAIAQMAALGRVNHAVNAA